MRFADRIEAAERLADALQSCRTGQPLVLAVPRGGLPMAQVIAQRLHGELDVVLVRKLRSPFSPEYAIGAVDETGWTYIAPHASAAGASDRYIAEETRRQLAVLRERRSRYTPGRAGADPAGRTAIVVDDGLATGSTMLAALHAVRARAPKRLVCAVPVASRQALELVRPHADEVVCLHVPEDFYAVGQFYRVFAQVEDDEPIAILAHAGSGRPAAR